MWVFSSVWVIIPSTKFFLGSFCYCLFVSLFIYYFLNNGGWHAFWAGFGDDYQSTLFVSNDHSVCNFPTCPSNGLRNHNFKVVASGYQCIKGQVFGFPALCLSNDKIVNQLITKKKKRKKKWKRCNQVECFESWPESHSSGYRISSSMWQRCSSHSYL